MKKRKKKKQTIPSFDRSNLRRKQGLSGRPGINAIGVIGDCPADFRHPVAPRTRSFTEEDEEEEKEEEENEGEKEEEELVDLNEQPIGIESVTKEGEK